MKQIPFPKKKYNIIYVDPPWNRDSQFGSEKKRGNLPYFPLMTMEDIKSLPVNNLAADNCVLFLWIIDMWLFKAEEVINSWGFKYITVGFTWVKETVTGKDVFGVGSWTRKNTEICLLAKKGRPQRADPRIRQLQRHMRRGPCRKPDEIRNEIVRLCGDLPRIELFARPPKKSLFRGTSWEGWDVWGNEA